MVSKLKLLRMNKNMNQYELSVKVGIKENRISQIETGRIKASPHEKKKIAEALGLSEEQLF